MIKKSTVKVGNRELDIVNKDQHPQPIFTETLVGSLNGYINAKGKVFNIDSIYSQSCTNKKIQKALGLDYNGIMVPEERIPNWIIKQLK